MSYNTVLMIARLFLMLALVAAQFAPAMHGLAPHDDQRAHCMDGARSTHVERHTIDHEDDDCSICVVASSGSVLLDDYRAVIGGELQDVVVEIVATLPVALPFSHPDSRGPPSEPA
jgi:hypothetical protein